MSWTPYDYAIGIGAPSASWNALAFDHTGITDLQARIEYEASLVVVSLRIQLAQLMWRSYGDHMEAVWRHGLDGLFRCHARVFPKPCVLTI
jgi:hypothetical protein